ncbi:MAG: DNA-formamidopyrimidine glycosylase family protein [Candidatus Bathyarchaeia archaeon]|jgi:formamidopyrimidine-DNA glycosylase
MSVELPEAKILSEQMNQQLLGKQVKSCQVQDCERLQKIGMIDKDIAAFNKKLENAKIWQISFRGNVIVVKFDNKNDLIIGLEYGGELFYHVDPKDVTRFHLRIEFTDNTVLTVRLTSMGVIQLLDEDNLEDSYVYKRDFDSTKLSPSDKEFTLEQFSKQFAAQNKVLKAVLVGKDAILVGISNSTFQDIMYRAKLHPKRKASELTAKETKRLYDAIKYVVDERIRLHGKEDFLDLHQKHGGYTASMGPNMKDQKCPTCGTTIIKLAHGGGHIFLCPKCQV